MGPQRGWVVLLQSGDESALQASLLRPSWPWCGNGLWGRHWNCPASPSQCGREE